MQAYLRLLGRPEIEWEGRTFPLPFERRHQLVAYLVMRRAWVGRPELAELLWPQQEARLSAANLRKTLFRLHELPWGGAIESQGNALRFTARTDVGQDGQPPGEFRELLAGYDEGGEAWRQWLAFERERQRTAWRGGLLERLQSPQLGAHEAVELSAWLVAADPADEPALLAHMAALVRAGQPGRARDAFRAFESRLSLDFGLAPGAAARAAFEALEGGAAVAGSRALPVQEDADFVGRTVELRQLFDWLTPPGRRVVCILGPGGAGKTRLAARALEQLAPRYADGACFVALEDAEPGSDITPRLARALDLPLGGAAPPLEQVVRGLREQQRLLVLDNLEHLTGATALLQDLLRQCPRVNLLVTSRVRPAFEQQQALQLDGLPCPDPEDEDRLESFDAARMFLAAARRVDPSFAPSASARSIIDICRQVEGLPLALEIAAGWTRVLSCAAIAGELRHSTELLQTDDPARPARHASMETVFGQSWALLGTIEREAFARLSVFRGGFTLASARAVAGAALPVLVALADKSLLRKEGERLQVHPLLQQLGSVRLARMHDMAATEEAHARHFHRLLAQLQRPSATGDRAALAEIETELENCRKAWHWAVANGRGEWLARSCATVRNFFDLRGRAAEGLGWLQQVIDAGKADLEAVKPLLLSSAAHLQYRQDRYADAIATATLARPGAGGEHDHETLLQCFKTLAVCSLRLARYGDARSFFQRALELAPESADPRNAAAMLDNLSLVEKSEGRPDEALRMSLAALAKFRDIRDVAGEALCLNNVGTLEGDMGRTAAAIGHLREALALCERHALTSTRTYVLANLAEQSVNAGDLEAAISQAGQALEAVRATGNRMVEGWVRLQLARAQLGLSRTPQAVEALKQAGEVALALKSPVLMLACAAQLADVLEARGETGGGAMLRRWTVAQPGLQAPLRQALQARLEPGGVPAALDAMGPVELCGRLVLEAEAGWEPLLAQWRA